VDHAVKQVKVVINTIGPYTLYGYAKKLSIDCQLIFILTDNQSSMLASDLELITWTLLEKPIGSSKISFYLSDFVLTFFFKKNDPNLPRTSR